MALVISQLCFWYHLPGFLCWIHDNLQTCMIFSILQAEIHERKYCKHCFQASIPKGETLHMRFTKHFVISVQNEKNQFSMLDGGSQNQSFLVRKHFIVVS